MQLTAEVTVPRDAKYVATLRRVLQRVMVADDAPAETVHEAKLALSEACANVIRHAEGSSTYHVELALGDQECEVRISDHGPGFDAQPSHFEPSLSTAEDGRGLALIDELVDNLALVNGDDGMQVRFTKSW
jgi:serine/threonine-protein kinase RsbW